MITILLFLIFLLLVGFGTAAFIAWQKISVFLTWNTRYESLEYEQAIKKPKTYTHPEKASKTEQRGRSIKPVDDLVDLEDLDFETAVKAVEEIANG